MLIEIVMFRLKDGIDERRFLDADAIVQAALSPMPGFMRRTTARSEPREWAVITLWDSVEDAERGRGLPESATFDELIDEASVETKRYTALEG